MNAKDHKKAAEYFAQAAVYNEKSGQAGDVNAQYALASLYATGQGVEQNNAKAVKFLRYAAQDGHTKAQYALGGMFMAGKGVPQSAEIAYLWIARAAEGDTVTRSLDESAKAALAASDGRGPAIAARNALRARYSAAQIAEATVLVDRCIKSKPACNWGD